MPTVFMSVDNEGKKISNDVQDRDNDNKKKIIFVFIFII